jgi:tetratricopeptide (TPR) repeat protein
MTVVAMLLLMQASLSQQGAQAMREGRFTDAQRIYRELLKENPDEVRLRMNLGLALHSAGDYTAATREFDTYLKVYPKPGPVHLLLGVARLKLRQPCEAIPPLERAKEWQSSAQVLVELGDAYFGCRRYAEAARTFEQLGPTPKGLQGAGLSYARLGRQKEAQEAFDRLASLPASAELHELLSDVRTLEGRHEDALAELDNAVKLSPNDSRLRRLRARGLWRTAKYDDARKAYEELADRWSHDPEFNFERGDTLVRTVGVEAGLPLLEQAVKAAPTLLPARAALGRALVQAGRAAEAIPHLEAGSTQDPTLLLPLSRAYKAAGRADDAARAEKEYRLRVSAQN